MKHFLILLLTILPLTVEAQISRLGQDVFYEGSVTGAFSGGDYAPFWFTNNRYGLSSHKNNYGYLRGTIRRDVMTDSLRNWRIGYGADLAVAVGMESKHFIVQQLYADFQWKALRLSLGQKERPLELKNQALSSGGMTTGINARPLPQIRLEIPDFLAIPGTKKWHTDGTQTMPGNESLMAICATFIPQARFITPKRYSCASEIRTNFPSQSPEA